MLGGRGFFDFTESPASPVMLRRDIMWTNSFERIDGHSYRFYPSYDLKRYHYAILHTPDQIIASVAALAMQPEERASRLPPGGLDGAGIDHSRKSRSTLLTR